MAREEETSERIYLQLFETSEGGHTWCDERINDEDVAYVRADLVDQAIQVLKDAAEIIDAMMPGVMLIAFQDFAKLNDTCIAIPRTIKALEENKQ
jgi:hypothetical protein